MSKLICPMTRKECINYNWSYDVDGDDRISKCAWSDDDGECDVKNFFTVLASLFGNAQIFGEHAPVRIDVEEVRS